MGPEWPENAARKNRAGDRRLHRGLSGLCRHGLQDLQPLRLRDRQGVVAAPPKEDLLRPAQFSQEHLPDLGKVWAAQERLWIQRTVLEVIAQVNKNAKNWDDAIIKQILSLEVGNPDAQDQQSLAKGDSSRNQTASSRPAKNRRLTGPRPSGTASMLPAGGGRAGPWAACSEAAAEDAGAETDGRHGRRMGRRRHGSGKHLLRQVGQR